MVTTRIKALQLRNNDRILGGDKVFTVTNFQMVIREDVVTYHLTDAAGVTTPRWAAMDSIITKVVVA